MSSEKKLIPIVFEEDDECIILFDKYISEGLGISSAMRKVQDITEEKLRNHAVKIGIATMDKRGGIHEVRK